MSICAGKFFRKEGQLISVSGFYKYFNNPIEIVQYIQATNNFQPRNVGDGSLMGVEFEFMQNLGRFWPALQSFTLNGNLTLVNSTIEMNETEFLSRQRFKKDGQTISKHRAMAGQAPYLINTGVTFNSRSNRLETGLYYNVQGPTLLFVGIVDRPDVFSVPFHSLNYNLNYSFGGNDQFKVGFKVSNLLNQTRREIFKAYNAEDQTFTQIRPLRQFSLSLGLRI
jgi:outer membrane receptor protein involved in Fe transport